MRGRKFEKDMLGLCAVHHPVSVYMHSFVCFFSARAYMCGCAWPVQCRFTPDVIGTIFTIDRHVLNYSYRRLMAQSSPERD